MPKPPRVDLRRPRQPFTVLKASLRAPPTTGTKLDRENLMARPPNVSAAAPTRLCRDKSPTNRVDDMLSSQTAVLLMNPATASSFMPLVTEPVMPSAKEIVIKGRMMLVASHENSSATNSTMLW